MKKKSMNKTIALALAAITICSCNAMAKSETIVPQPAEIKAEEIDFGILNAGFDPANIKVNEDGTAVIENVSLYTEDTYDIVDIGRLEKGDTIRFKGKDMVVETIEREGNYLLVNGGTDEDGATFAAYEDTNGWSAVEYDDLGVFTEQCVAELPVSADVVYRDSSELGKDKVEVKTMEKALEAMKNENGEFKQFGAYNTTITVEEGVITAIDHIYVP